MLKNKKVIKVNRISIANKIKFVINNFFKRSILLVLTFQIIWNHAKDCHCSGNSLSLIYPYLQLRTSSTLAD